MVYRWASGTLSFFQVLLQQRLLQDDSLRSWRRLCLSWVTTWVKVLALLPIGGDHSPPPSRISLLSWIRAWGAFMVMTAYSVVYWWRKLRRLVAAGHPLHPTCVVNEHHFGDHTHCVLHLEMCTTTIWNSIISHSCSKQSGLKLEHGRTHEWWVSRRCSLRGQN
jgi:hypothetical protein